MRERLFPSLMCLLMIVSLPALSLEQKEAEKIVKDAIARESSVDAQMQALIKLAWFDSTAAPEVCQFAKKEIKDYGQWGKTMLDRAVLSAPSSAQKEMIPLILWAYDDAQLSYDREYVATFTYLVERAEREIKIMAMDALAKYHISDGYLAVIDAAYKDPSLQMLAIKTLGALRSPRSVNYLMEKIASPDSKIADAAEEALSQFPAEASLQLKKGLIDDRSEVRERCLRIYLPISTIDDISLLYHIQLKSDQFEKKLVDDLQKRIDKLTAEKARVEQEAKEQEE